MKAKAKVNRSDHPCGATDPKRVSSTAASVVVAAAATSASSTALPKGALTASDSPASALSSPLALNAVVYVVQAGDL